MHDGGVSAGRKAFGCARVALGCGESHARVGDRSDSERAAEVATDIPAATMELAACLGGLDSVALLPLPRLIRMANDLEGEEFAFWARASQEQFKTLH
jgi:hypothetical protein